VQNVERLEYDLTTAILKLTRPRKVVAFLTGHGERDLYGDYAAVNQLLSKQYEVRTQDLSDGSLVPEDVDTLVVAGPKQTLSERDLYALDQFLMRGGGLIYLLDPVEMQPGVMQARPVLTGLDDMLAHYGVRPRAALVEDWQANEVVQFASQQAAGFRSVYVMQYPLWPKIVEGGFSATNPATAQLSSVVLPWAGPLEVLDDRPEGVQVDVLASTTEFASIQEGYFRLEPRMLQEPPPEEELQSQVLAVSLTGSFPSFFAGKPIPEPPVPEDGEPPPVAAVEDTLETSQPTQMVVVGNADFLTDANVQQFAQNAALFLNLVDWLTLGDELIGIRARQTAQPMLRFDISETEKAVWRLFNIVLVPLLVALAGVVWRMLRRRRRGALP
jgi:gliding-associated putative ABC transporter substrate-binding component GldG